MSPSLAQDPGTPQAHCLVFWGPGYPGLLRPFWGSLHSLVVLEQASCVPTLALGAMVGVGQLDRGLCKVLIFDKSPGQAAPRPGPGCCPLPWLRVERKG